MAASSSEKYAIVSQKDAPESRVSNGPVVVHRDVWGKGWEFVLACVGYAVGLGNIWRFPYLCYKNGGGAFLIPYFVYLACAGAPLLFLEVGLGQFMRQGNISIWNICPIFKGIGFGTTLMVAYCNISYIVVLAWALHYLYYSVSLDMKLPWGSCGNEWNTPNCFTSEGNQSVAEEGKEVKDSVIEYWDRKVLKISSGLDEVGGLQWELVLSLGVAWILIYLCVFKGVRSSGKVVYFTATFPYVMLSVLLVKGITLPGAFDGLKYYISPDFDRLRDTQVWIEAGTQVLYSFACTFGGMVSLGSYNRYHRDFIRDCSFICGINAFSSLFSGCVIFSVLGYMSYVTGIPIDNVAESGPGLAFIVYPKAISLLPGSSIWSVLFFLMIVLMAVDSQFVCVEAVITAFIDITPACSRFKYSREVFSAVVCFLSFLPGLTMVTHGGIYVFQIFDNYVACGMVLLTFCFFESIAIAWVYGVNNWYKNIEEMTGRKLGRWFKFCWGIITPSITLGLLLSAIIKYKPLVYNKTYVYPWWGQLLGIGLGSTSCIFVPLYFFYALIKAPGVKLAEKWKNAIAPRMQESNRIRQLQQEHEEGIRLAETKALTGIEIET